MMSTQRSLGFSLQQALAGVAESARWLRSRIARAVEWQSGATASASAGREFACAARAEEDLT